MHAQAEPLYLIGLQGIFGRNALQNRVKKPFVAIDYGPVALGDGCFHRMRSFWSNQFDPADEHPCRLRRNGLDLEW